MDEIEHFLILTIINLFQFKLGSLIPPDFSHGYNLDPSSQLGSYGSCVAPKPEWKRYKQYSKSDLMDAIEAVKGGMTALMVSI